MILMDSLEMILLSPLSMGRFRSVQEKQAGAPHYVSQSYVFRTACLSESPHHSWMWGFARDWAIAVSSVGVGLTCRAFSSSPPPCPPFSWHLPGFSISQGRFWSSMSDNPQPCSPICSPGEANEGWMKPFLLICLERECSPIIYH